MAEKTYQTVAEILADGFVLLKQSNEHLLDFHLGQRFIFVYSSGDYGSMDTLMLAEVVGVGEDGYIRLDLKTSDSSIVCVFPPAMLFTAKDEALSGAAEINLVIHFCITICFSQIYFRPEVGESVANSPEESQNH
jgi:hypothetical protein